jgi:DNA-binding PadR family transcriptional regulator
MFKKQHVYGKVLLYLYNNPDKRFDVTYLHEQFPKVAPTYLKTVIDWLDKDGLIIKETETYRDIYRISYQGFAFINDLKHKRQSRNINSIAIIAACVGILVNFFVLNHNPAISKVDIINPIKVQSIKNTDTVKGTLKKKQKK